MSLKPKIFQYIYINQYISDFSNRWSVNISDLNFCRELIDFSGNVTARAPLPLLNIGVRQNGEFVDTALNVSPGTPLEMVIYLDEVSASVYGLLTSFLRVTDNTPRKQEEVIILNGYVLPFLSFFLSLSLVCSFLSPSLSNYWAYLSNNRNFILSTLFALGMTFRVPSCFFFSPFL